MFVFSLLLTLTLLDKVVLLHTLFASLGLPIVQLKKDI